MKEQEQKKNFFIKLIGSTFNTESIYKNPIFFRQQVEAVKKNKELYKFLLKVIKTSKSTGKDFLARAASNAMTILNRAGFQFNEFDFSNIKIPGADLSYGHFRRANFKGADLRGVNFLESDISDSWMDDAKLEGASFQKNIYLKQKSLVKSMAYSFGGIYLAIGDDKGYIQIYEAKTQKCIKILENWNFLRSGFQDNPVNCISFTSDSHYLAAGSQEGDIRIWSIPEGSFKHSLCGHVGPVKSLHFSKDNKFLISGGRDGFIKIWDVSSGKGLREIDGNAGPVNCTLLSSSGNEWFAGDESGRLGKGTVNPFKHLEDKQTHQGAIVSMSLSLDGKFMATGGSDFTVAVWKLDSMECQWRVSSHQKAVKTVCFSPDGNYIISVGEDEMLYIWSFDSGNSINQLKIGCVSNLCISPDGKSIVLSYEKKSVIIPFNPYLYIPYLIPDEVHIKNHVVCISPDGILMVSGSENTILLLWNVYNGKCMGSLKGHQHRIRSITFSPDGKYLLSTEDKAVFLWSMDSGENIAQLTFEDKLAAAIFSPEGNFIALGRSHCAEVWSFDLKERIYLLEHKEFRTYLERIIDDGGNAEYVEYECLEFYKVKALAFFPGGKQLFVSTYMGDFTEIWGFGNFNQIWVWSMETGFGIKTTLSDRVQRLPFINFSPSQDYFLLSRIKYPPLEINIEVFNNKDYSKKEAILIKSTKMKALSFSSDGKFIAYAGSSHTLEIWSLEQKSAFQVIPVRDKILSFIFSPDDCYLVIGTRKTIQVFEKINDFYYQSCWKYDPLMQPQKEESLPLFFEKAGSQMSIHRLLGLSNLEEAQNRVFLLKHLENPHAFLLIESIFDDRCYTMQAGLVRLNKNLDDSLDTPLKAQIIKLNDLSGLVPAQGHYIYQSWLIGIEECGLLLRSIRKEKKKDIFYSEAGDLSLEIEPHSYLSWCINKLSLIDRRIDESQWKDFVCKETPKIENDNCCIM